MVTLHPKKPGGAVIEVWYNTKYYYPHWSFAITHQGVRRKFIGSNKCDSKHSAICKARIRAKWLDEGTWDEHYIIASHVNKPIETYNNAMKRIEENNITDRFKDLGL